MSVKEILREFEALPSEQHWNVLEGLRRLVEPEIPAVRLSGRCHRAATACRWAMNRRATRIRVDSADET
jgi:hypothetical protein